MAFLEAIFFAWVVNSTVLGVCVLYIVRTEHRLRRLEWLAERNFTCPLLHSEEKEVKDGN